MPYMPQGVDPWVIPTPEPGRKYRWISSKPEKLGQWLRSYGDRPGYALVRGKTIEDTKRKAVELGLSDEMVDLNMNRIAYGHNILASIPIEEYVLRDNELINMKNSAIGAAKENFHAVVDSIPNVTSFERTPDEHKDRKRIATRPDRPVSGQAGVGTSPHLKTPRNRAVAR